MRNIIWYGLRRSGNHGLIALFFANMLRNMPTSNAIIHINNVVLSHSEYLKYSTRVINPNSKTAGIFLGSDGHYTGFKGAETVIISMENKLPDFGEINKFGENTVTCILLRNPFNNLASFWKLFKGKRQLFLRTIQLWKQYADLFLNPRPNYVYIIYDKFYRDIDYQKSILTRLGISYQTVRSKISLKPGYARSSWSRDESANPNRYQLLQGDQWFQEHVMRDLELHDLWHRICEMYDV